MARGGPLRSGFGRRAALLVIGLTPIAALMAYLIFVGERPRSIGPETFASPFTTVSYVGSEGCVECHREATESFHATAMAKSISRIDAIDKSQLQSKKVRLPPAFPFRYQLQTEMEELRLTEIGLTGNGRPSYQQTVRLDWAIGSGSHARTFMFSRPGMYLFEAPLTWYRQLDGWAMSPGYERVDHKRLHREISYDCLFCHAGSANHVSGTRNHYASDNPLPEHAIGCERCHGPAANHVAHYGEGREGLPPAADIVNPASLPFAIANDVCLQCHRTGSDSREVLRPGRNWSDFRPGMPLNAIAQQFTDLQASDPSPEAGIHFTGKMTQLSRSRCFQASSGKLGCLTCHSIHHRPPKDQEVGYFRTKCLSCHAMGCKSPEPQRLKIQPDDACHRCHMPSVAPSDVPHTTITDHRIRTPSEMRSTQSLVAGELTPIFSEGIDEVETRRNLGIAYGHRGAENGSRGDHERAIELLEKTKKAFIYDPQHHYALGLSYGMLGKNRAAAPLLKRAVELDDRFELAHNALASAAFLINDEHLARAHLEKSIEINPYKINMLTELAALEIKARRWERARELLKRVLEVDAGNADVRRTLSRIETAMQSFPPPPRQTAEQE